jgi:hypothetical protein
LGAADGLRRRGGLRPWPVMRRVETELTAQIRLALGTERFNRSFAAGFELRNAEAAAAARDASRAPRAVGGKAPVARGA